MNKKPFILESNLIVGVDVDDTLVSWEFANEERPHPDCEKVEIVFQGKTSKYWIFPANIRSLITHKLKGHNIVVWSGSGFEWAQKVVETLGLESFVDIIMSKPRWLLDDMKPEDFMPRSYWGAGDPGKAKLK